MTPADQFLCASNKLQVNIFYTHYTELRLVDNLFFNKKRLSCRLSSPSLLKTNFLTQVAVQAGLQDSNSCVRVSAVTGRTN